MILFLLFSAIANAGGGCMTFDLKGKTSDPRWSEVILFIAKDFSQRAHVDLPITSRRADGKSWAGNFSCSRLNNGTYSCYGEDDRGEFRLQPNKAGMKILLSDPIEVGYEEEPEKAKIAPKGEELELEGSACTKGALK